MCIRVTFAVKVPVVAAAGEHTVAGSLRYQACDHAACYPPKVAGGAGDIYCEVSVVPVLLLPAGLRISVE